MVGEFRYVVKLAMVRNLCVQQTIVCILYHTIVKIIMFDPTKYIFLFNIKFVGSVCLSVSENPTSEPIKEGLLNCVSKY